MSYSRAARLDPLNGKAYLGIARAEIRLGNRAEAEPALTRALDTLHDWPSIRECYVQLSEIYLDRPELTDSYLDAVGRMASELLSHDPRSFDGHRFWAELARRKGESHSSTSEADNWNRKALREFALANEIKPNDPAILGAWAAALESTQDFEGARKMYAHLLSLRPNDFSIEVALYRIALRQGDLAGQHRYIEESLHAPRENSGALLELAREAISGGQMGDAHEILSSLAHRAVDPDSLANLLAKAGSPTEAVEVLREAARSQPAKAQHFFDQGIQKLTLLGHDKGLKSMGSECFAKFPYDTLCQGAQLFADYRLNPRNSTLEQLERLTSKNPNNPDLRLYLGSAYRQQGRLRDAIFQYNLGLNQDQGDTALRIALAELEAESGAPEAARADISYVLMNDPLNYQARAVLNGLEPHHQP